jgi:hypothetical protein
VHCSAFHGVQLCWGAGVHAEAVVI